MIDFKNELQNYPPVDLEKLSESNPNMPDNIKNSIVLYNKALENFRTKSEDIAIIELRKAISLNPDFHEAINLLGVFYMYTGDYSKASQTFQKVIDAERNSIIALEYLKEIDSGYESSIQKQGKGKKKANKTVKKSLETSREDKDLSLSFKKLVRIGDYRAEDIARVSIGFIAGVLLVFLLSFKFYFKEEAVNTSGQLDQELKAAMDLKDQYETKYNELNVKYEELNSQFEDVNKQVDYYLNVSKLLEIESLVSDKKHREAADKLLLLKNTGFTGIEKEKYDKLVQDTMPKAAQDEYNEGREFYTKKAYQEALDRFNKVRSYADDWKYSVNNLYYIGVCYQQLNNSTMALKVFEEVIEKYPSSAYSRYSKNRINQIKQAEQ